MTDKPPVSPDDWNAAIEAAAKEAEHWQSINPKIGHVCGEYIAAAIRRLKQEPPVSPDFLKEAASLGDHRPWDGIRREPPVSPDAALERIRNAKPLFTPEQIKAAQEWTGPIACGEQPVSPSLQPDVEALQARYATIGMWDQADSFVKELFALIRSLALQLQGTENEAERWKQLYLDAVGRHE